MTNVADLQQRVAASLKDESAASLALQGLLDEAGAAHDHCNVQLGLAANRAIDPLRDSVSAAAEQKRCDSLTFDSTRWAAAVSHLSRALLRAQAREAAQRNDDRYFALAKEHAALVEEVKEVYPSAVNQLVDLFRRIEALDGHVRGVNTPAGQPRLLQVETVARGVTFFIGLDIPPRLTSAMIPNFERRPHEPYAWNGRGRS